MWANLNRIGPSNFPNNGNLNPEEIPKKEGPTQNSGTQKDYLGRLTFWLTPQKGRPWKETLKGPNLNHQIIGGQNKKE